MFDRYGRVLPAGTVLFREGDLGKHMYVIQSGRVQLTRRVRGQETYLATLPAGEFFGEMAIINNLPRTATATVLEESRVLELDARTFELIIRGNAEIAVRLIKKLAARLEQANRQVETLLKQNIHHRIVHHLRQLAETRGTTEGPGVRIDVSLDEIAAQVGADGVEVARCLISLEEAKLLHRDLGSLVIAEVGRLEQFLEFLEIKERYAQKNPK
jgi:CRP-like cAMP-binding protein